jgi:hypothetical protein
MPIADSILSNLLNRLQQSKDAFSTSLSKSAIDVTIGLEGSKIVPEFVAMAFLCPSPRRDIVVALL